MKSLFELVESHPTTIAAISGIVPLLFPRVRASIAKWWKRFGAKTQKLDLILAKVTNIETEIQFSNDTSTKQEVALLKNRQRLDFWRSARPALEMDGDAQVLHVSESLCRLLGVATPNDLHLRNWLRFVHGEGVDDFLVAFAECVKFKSACDFVFHLQTTNGDSIGRWKLLSSPVSPVGYSKPLYSGYFVPLDEKAKDTAGGLHWAK